MDTPAGCNLQIPRMRPIDDRNISSAPPHLLSDAGGRQDGTNKGPPIAMSASYSGSTEPRNRFKSDSSDLMSDDAIRTDSVTSVMSASGRIAYMSEARACFKSWSDVAPQAKFDAASPQERKRQNALLEMLSTEETFVEDLKVLLREYATDVFSPSKLPAEPFKPLKSMLETAEAFLTDLQKHQKENNFVIVDIGPIFLSHFERLESCYMAYPKIQKEIQSQIDKLKADKELGSIIRNALTNAALNCGGMDLNSYLLKPFQRMTRYPLLLKEIVKHTKNTSAEAQYIERAYQKAVKLVKRCNESKRVQELQELFEDIRNSVLIADEVLGLDLYPHDAERLLGKPSEGVVALLCETLAVGSLSGAKSRKSTKKGKIEVSVPDLNTTGGFRREHLYDNGRRMLLLLQDPVAGPFLVVLQQCVTTLSNKNHKQSSADKYRYVVSTRRIPLADVKIDSCSPVSDKKKLSEAENLSGLVIEFECPWRNNITDKKLKDPIEELVLKCTSRESMKRILHLFRHHKSRYAGRYIRQTVLDEILQYTKPKIPHERGSQGEKLQIAAGIVEKLVLDCRRLEYIARNNASSSFVGQSPTDGRRSTGGHSSPRKPGMPRTASGSRRTSLLSSDISSSSTGGTGPRRPRPLSAIFDDMDSSVFSTEAGDYSVMSPGISPFSPRNFVLPDKKLRMVSNLSNSSEGTVGSPLVASSAKTNSTDSGEEVVSKLSKRLSRSLSRRSEEPPESSPSGLSEEDTELFLDLLKQQDQEFNAYAEDLHSSIQNLEDELLRELEEAEEFRRLTEKKETMAEEAQIKALESLQEQEILIKDCHSIISDLFAKLGIDKEVAGAVSTASLSTKLSALCHLAAHGPLSISANTESKITYDLKRENELLKQECNLLRHALGSVSNGTQNRSSIQSDDTVEDHENDNIVEQLIAENHELQQKVDTVQNELTEMTLQLAAFLEEQIEEGKSKKDGNWVPAEEHNAVVSRLEEVEYELEVSRAELDTLSEDLVDLHSLESKLFGSPEDEHPLWSKTGSLVRNAKLDALQESESSA